MALAPLVLSSYDLSLLGRFLGMSILGIGISLVWGHAGILSLGQGAFFGLGAYALAMHLKMVADNGFPDFMVWNGVSALPWWWVPFGNAWFAIAAVLALPAAAGTLLGWLFFRKNVTGVYIALITQALVLAFTTLLISQQGMTGGFNGLTNFRTLLGFSLNDSSVRLGLYWVTVAFLIVSFIGAHWITTSHIGKVVVAIRDGENRVRFLGYDPAMYKTFIFAVGAVYAGIAGALFTLHVGVISPAMFSVVPSIEMVIGVALGGRDVLAGAVLGTTLLNVGKDRISSAFPEAWLYGVGILFIVVVRFMPGGIMGAISMIRVQIPQILIGFRMNTKEDDIGESASRA